MHCEQAQPQLVAFLLGELSEREANRIASHISGCEGCLLELDSLRATTNILFRFGETEPALVAGEGAVAELAERAYRKRRVRIAPSLPKLRRWAPGLAALTAAVLLVALRTPRPVPFAPGAPASSTTPRVAKADEGRAAPVDGERGSEAASAPRLVATASSQGRVVGTVVSAKGRPQIKTSESGWVACRTAQAVPSGAAVKTGDTGQVDIELADGSRVNLDFDTTAEFKPDQAEGKSSRPASLSLTEGKMWLLVAPAQAGLTVETPAARAKALGTLFSISVSPEQHATPALGKGPWPEPTSRTSLTVVRGKVQFSNEWGIVTAGRESYTEATAGRPPSPPRGLQHLRTVRLQTPWGQTTFEVWVADRLRQEDALRRVAGSRAWLGLTTVPGSSRVGEATAPIVTSVTPGSPAAEAGIQPGDRLVRIGDVALDSPVDLAKAEILLAADQPVEVVAEREGRPTTARITPVTRRAGGEARDEALLVEGNRALALDRPMDAERIYRSAIRKDGSDAAAWNNLGVVTQFVSAPDLAVGSFREAVQLDPRVALYHFNFGICYSGVGNLERARSELATAVAADPGFPGGRAMLGRMEALAGYADAATEQAKALESAPETRAQGYFLAGEILRINGDANASEQWYLKAAEADRYYVEPPTALGAVYYNQGKLDEAKQWLDKALALDPLSLPHAEPYGPGADEDGRPEWSRGGAEEGRPVLPGLGNRVQQLGPRISEEERAGAGAAAFRRGLELDPSSTLSHTLMAIGLEASNQFDGAKREYETALRLDPTYQEGYQRLAALHRQLGEVSLARRGDGESPALRSLALLAQDVTLFL